MNYTELSIVERNVHAKRYPFGIDFGNYWQPTKHMSSIFV